MAQPLLTEVKSILPPTHICANISQTHTHMLLVHQCSIYQNFIHTRSSQHIQTHTPPSFFCSHTHWWFVAVTSMCGPIASARCHAVVSHRTDNGKVKGRVWERGCGRGLGALRHFGKLANVPRERGGAEEGDTETWHHRIPLRGGGRRGWGKRHATWNDQRTAYCALYTT